MLSEKFERYVKDNSLVADTDRVLLAVSGGVDSMVMLSLFANAGYNIGVAHCNFQLRGQDAMEDELVVEKQAAKFGVPFYNMRFDTASEMDRTGESVQMAARRLRYAWFDQLCNEHNYQVIGIAHHIDDSIETFFINMLRGTGLRGLTGINVINGKVVRPLLFASRKDILDYAHTNKITFREDSSNLSTKYMRNKIRLGLIPRIREINPHFGEQMSVNIQRLTETQLFIDSCIGKLSKEIQQTDNGILTVDPAKIGSDMPVNFVIFELFKKYGFKGDVIDGLCKSLRNNTSGRKFYSKDYVAYTDRGKILLSPITDDDSRLVEVEPSDHKVYYGNNVLIMDHISVDDLETLNLPSNVALIDSQKLEYPLTLRLWRDGDEFIPFGMEGHKLVSDFLIDEKVSMAEKRRQFVLCCGENIVWLVGRRIDDRYKIEKDTDKVLRITKEF